MAGAVHGALYALETTSLFSPGDELGELDGDMAQLRMPSFVFRIDHLRPDPRYPQRRENAQWGPPRRQGANQILQDGDWLHYDPMKMPTVQVIEALPSNAEHIQTISMYYAHGNFFIVPYDASTCQVGDGSGNETGDWAEDNAGDDEHSWADWDSLGFTSIDDGNSSLAKIHGTQLSLYRHREDQKAWVEQLLPTTYHPAPANQAALNGQGGMSGTLGILLGLIAFSAPESKESVTAAMRQCMQAHAWRPHTYEKGAGWKDRRGMVVRTYRRTTGTTTWQALDDFQQGRSPKPYP